MHDAMYIDVDMYLFMCIYKTALSIHIRDRFLKRNIILIDHQMQSITAFYTHHFTERGELAYTKKVMYQYIKARF